MALSRWASSGMCSSHTSTNSASLARSSLGQRIIRLPLHPKPYVYTFVSNEAPASIRRKVKALTGRSTTNMELSDLLAALNRVLRGWANYFQHAAAKHTFAYLGYYAWWRVGRWLRKKHPRLTWKQINRRYTRNGSFHPKGISLLNPASISVTRYRYRGSKIPTPWNEHHVNPNSTRARRGRYPEQLVLERVQQALE